MRQLLLIACCCGLLAACGAGPAASQAPQSCRGAFEATVHQGPDAGLSVTGDLQIAIDPSGHITGALVRSDGLQVVASGQTVGQAISMVFQLAKDQTIFGVGALTDDPRICTGVGGGPLTGPKPGDSGDWRWTP